MSQRVTPNHRYKAWKIFGIIGVYAWRRGDEWLYIGMSDSVFRRINDRHHVINRLEEVIYERDEFYIYECDSLYEAEELERELIQRHRPKYNTAHCKPRRLKPASIAAAGITQ